MKQIIEKFGYKDIPLRQMVTIDGKDCWWESTCIEDIDREFQLYQNGDYIRTLHGPIDKKAMYYCCDKYGNYLPKSLLMEIKALKKQATSNLYKCINTGAIVRKIGKPFIDKTLFSKDERIRAVIIDHILSDDIGNEYDFLLTNLIQL